MSKSKELGQEGEQLAAEYLQKSGWHIREMNYRYSRSEIDLIASKNETLIFVEVKARTNTSFGFPEQYVDDYKAALILKAADHYVHEINWKGNIRFDIVSIIKNTVIELKHIEDAFY